MTEAIYFTFLALLVLPALDYFLALYILPDVKTSAISKDFPNAVSAIIACHNEEVHIERKVRELTTQFVDAGVTDFEIIVVSDGSTDNSNKILERLDSEGVVKYINLDERGGKPGALNRGIAISQHPVLLFSDVRQTFSQGAVKALLSHLTDSKIGAATSQLELFGDTSPTRKWMNNLKFRESRKGSTTGMCGALYVVRKELLDVLPSDTILDDLLVALFVMRHSKRVVLEPSAIVHDVTWDEFYTSRRQGRITAGFIQLLRCHLKLMFSVGLLQLLFLYGQKYMKYTAPMFLALASIAALFSEVLTMWHYACVIIVATLLTLFKPVFVAQILKLILGYMVQLLRLDKFSNVKWDR